VIPLRVRRAFACLAVKMNKIRNGNRLKLRQETIETITDCSPATLDHPLL
jgi:hypothetical protein